MKKSNADNLYLLAFIDISDRADILMLEIRHLQHSIIDSLHAPTLFLPLRHEEALIYGGWGEETDGSYKYDAAQVTFNHIVRYPSPRRAIQHLKKSTSTDDQISPINKALLTRVGEIWSGDLWTRGERRHYHVLRSLQILKQQVFRNKLIFYREARLAELISCKEGRLEKSALMILRRAILYRLNKFIRILRTHQQQFGKSLDFGLQGYPRPSIERRREIGIFNDFLSNRTRDIQQEMQHLVHSILKESPDDNSGQVTPLVLHGWSQSPRVSNTQLYDNVSLKLGLDKSEVEHVSYIDTSFWSPDRPDLQPLVAKEVADSVIRNRLGNLDDNYLSNRVNDFSTLMVILFDEINSFTKEIEILEPVRDNIRNLLRELANDFLAASVKGLSYLYALFLTIVGEGLEEQLRGTGTIHLSSIHELSGGVSSYETDFMWYFRLRLVSFWLRKISHVPISSIDEIVLSGTTQACDEIIGFLDANSPPTRVASGVLWRQLAINLEEKINRSYLIVDIRKWREKRSRDTWDEDIEESGDKNYHRSTIRLHEHLRSHLFEQILYYKSNEDYKPLYDCKSRSELLKKFTKTYDLEIEEVIIPYEYDENIEQPRWLFRHLYDIPFQCSIMRSIDFMSTASNSGSSSEKWKSFIKQTHNDMSMGRELFALALEFYTWGRESPKNRLALCINLLVFILPALDKKGENELNVIYEKLLHWLEGENDCISNSKEVITKDYSDYSHNEMREHFSLSHSRKNDVSLNELGAKQINGAYSLVRNGRKIKERRIEQLSGYKLKELISIYEDEIAKAIAIAEDKEHKDSLGLLAALGAFLRLRGSSNEKANTFYSLLLPSFGDVASDSVESKPNRLELPKLIKPVMISRIAMTNYYTVSNLLTSSESPNGLSLKEGVINPLWSSENNPSRNDEKESQILIQSIVLGRYDAVNIKSTRLPCRCSLPVFKEENNDDGLDEQANEKFVTHFIRREAALSVRIFSSNTNTIDNNNHLVAIISISLQRRAMRLNILYRILKAVSDINVEINDIPALELQMQNCIKGNSEQLKITGYLTDGWGDLLLVIETDSSDRAQEKNDNGECLIDRVFKLQQAIFEDFMVDRTELVFTPDCLDYIASSDSYDFAFALRLLEDRKLENSVQNYQAAFRDKKSKTKKFLDPNNISLVSTLGQIDYYVRLGVKNKKEKGIYKHLIEWLAQHEDIQGVSKLYPDGMAMLDRIETIIEKKVKE